MAFDLSKHFVLLFLDLIDTLLPVLRLFVLLFIRQIWFNAVEEKQPVAFLVFQIDNTRQVHELFNDDVGARQASVPGRLELLADILWSLVSAGPIMLLEALP